MLIRKLTPTTVKNSIANSKKAEIIWDCYNRRKCQGKRSDLYDGVKRNTLQKVSSQFGMSQSTFNKWLRIHYLIDYFKDWFDSGRLSLASAVELSYLSVRRQFLIYSVVNKYGGCIGKDKAIKLRSIPEIIGNGEAVEKSVYNIMYLDN